MTNLLSSLATIISASFLLKEGIRQVAWKHSYPSLADLWDRGVGSLDLDCMVELPGISPMQTSLLSNAPQLIISIIYTTINGMWTAMMVGNEWNGYGLRRKGLRTTEPVGQQRSTYWLSLPWVRRVLSQI